MSTCQVSSPISSSCYHPPAAPSDPSCVAHHPHPHSTLASQRAAAASVSPTLLDGVASTKAAKLVDCHSPAAGGLVYGNGSGPIAWWTPIQTAADQSNTRNGSTSSNQNAGGPHEDESSQVVELVPMSTRPRLRKVDDKGEPIWPPELEAVLIAALRKFHATSSRPRPSASRNFNRNRLVSDYIESITGKKRSTKQIASRIQVLRDAWKGTKQYALVAQPKELSEMGYLPIAEEDWPALKVAEPGPKEITGRTGPIRNSRGTRRSTRKVRQKHQPANVAPVDEPAELAATNVTLTIEGGSPSSVNDQDSQASVPSPPWDHSPAILSGLPTEKTHQSQALYAKTSDLRSTVQEDELRSTKSSPRQSSLSSVLVASLAASTISFNPFDLSSLGDVITNISGIVPDAVQLLVKNTLHRRAGATILLAHASLPPTGSSSVAVTPSLILEVNANSIQDKIDQLEEPEENRVKLGSQFMILQSSSVHDGARVTHARDAALVESEGASNLGSSRHGVFGAFTEENRRYPLVLHPKARDAFAKTHKEITVVQTITFLRMVDSRQLDSLVIIWIIEPTSSAASDMQFKLMRLQSAERRAVENPIVLKRASTRCKAPASIFSSLSSPLSSVESPCSLVVEPLSSTKGPNLTVQSTFVAEVVDSHRLPSPADSPGLGHESERQSPQFAYSTPELELLPEPMGEVQPPCSPPQLGFTPISVTTDCSEAIGHAGRGANYIQGQYSMTQAYDVVRADPTSSYHHNVHCNLEYSQASITPIPTSGMEYLIDVMPPTPSPPFLLTNYQNSPSSAPSGHYLLQPEHHQRQNHQVQQQAPVVLGHQAPVLGSDPTMSYTYTTSVHQPITQYDHQYQWVADQQMYAPRHIANGMSMVGTVDSQHTVKPSALSGAMINEAANRPHLTLEVDNMHGWYSSGPSPISAGVESALSVSSYSGPRRFSESATCFVEPHVVRRASVPALYHPNSTLAPFLSSQYPYSSSRQGSQYNVTHEAFVHDHEHSQASYPYRGTDYGVPTAAHMQTHPYHSMQGPNLDVDSSVYGFYH